MVKEIKRDYYLEQLIKREGNGLIKIVTGIRRCGKSYLLRTLFKNHLLEHGVDEKHIIEMAFDLFDNIDYRCSGISTISTILPSGESPDKSIPFWVRASR